MISRISTAYIDGTDVSARDTTNIVSLVIDIGSIYIVYTVTKNSGYNWYNQSLFWILVISGCR